MTGDQRELIKALRAVGAVGYHYTMAAFLLHANGLQNALEFVYGLQERGLTTIPKPVTTEQPRLL